MDFIDIRSLVLGGGVPAKRQALYIDRLNSWFNIQELYGDEKSAVLQAALEQKTGRVNIGVMYAGLVVNSLRYPHPDAAPTEPVAPNALAEPATEEEQAAYDKAVAQYRRDVAAYTHAYPTDHPHAGEKVFQSKDRDAVNSSMPGEVIDAIAEPAFALSGFKKNDVDEKKVDLKRTVIDSTITSLPSDSTDPTLTASSQS